MNITQAECNAFSQTGSIDVTVTGGSGSYTYLWSDGSTAEDRTNIGAGLYILETTDEFMAAVPWGDRRVVLVYRRQHGGRTYVRLRTWNRHRTRDVWYPTERFFVIPIGNAGALADALTAAASGTAEPKPDWLVAREEAESGKVAWMTEMEAPKNLVTRALEAVRRRRKDRV